MASVFLDSYARQDFNQLDGTSKLRVAAALIRLETEPELRGLPLSGSLRHWRKLVVGKREIRIVFQYNPNTDTVWVSAIGPRRDGEVYRIAASRIDNPGES